MKIQRAVGIFFLSLFIFTAACAAEDLPDIRWIAPGEGGIVDQVAFYPGGIYLASSDEATIKVWDTAALSLKYSIAAYSRAIAFSPSRHRRFSMRDFIAAPCRLLAVPKRIFATTASCSNSWGTRFF